MDVADDDDDQQLNEVWTPLGLHETDANARGLLPKVRTPPVSGKLDAPLTERMLREGEPPL